MAVVVVLAGAGVGAFLLLRGDDSGSEGDDFTAVRVSVTGCADPAVTDELDDSSFDVRLIDGKWRLDEAFVPLALAES